MAEQQDTLSELKQNLIEYVQLQLGSQIPQCKFCPTKEQFAGKKLFAVSKKLNSISGFD